MGKIKNWYKEAYWTTGKRKGAVRYDNRINGSSLFVEPNLGNPKMNHWMVTVIDKKDKQKMRMWRRTKKMTMEIAMKYMNENP